LAGKPGRSLPEAVCRVRESFTELLRTHRNKKTLLQEEFFELKKIADALADAGDGLTISPCVPGRDEREKTWIDAYTAWIDFEERIG
jgi:hypothetical protein